MTVYIVLMDSTTCTYGDKLPKEPNFFAYNQDIYYYDCIFEEKGGIVIILVSSSSAATVR